MLLAAGLGTRLWPLTEDRAKPAIPFLGRPLIRGLVERLRDQGFSRIVVNTHHRAESIRAALEGVEALGISLSFSHEPEILGTAGGLARARDLGLLDASQPTLIVNAKLYLDFDVGAAVRAHRASGAAVTLVLRPNVARERFREVLVEGDRVVGFGTGRDPEGPAPLLFTGIHMLEPEVLATIPLKFSDTIADIYPPYISAGRVKAHVDPSGRWWEFSTLERYLELHLRGHAEGLGPEISLSPGARVEPGAEVRRSVLWEDARIERGARAEDAVLGRGVVLRAGDSVSCAVVVRREHIQEAWEGRAEPLRGDALIVPLSPR